MPYDSKIRAILAKLDLGESPSTQEVQDGLMNYLFRVLEKSERKVRARSTTQDQKLKWSRVGGTHADILIRLFKIIELQELEVRIEQLEDVIG